MSTEFDLENKHLSELASRQFADREYSAALGNCLKLAENGYDEFQVSVGWMYLYGKGTHRDLDKAKYWFERAANCGNDQAQWYMGRLVYEDGDYNAALRWFEKSAAAGYAPALYRLAVHYDLGEGVKVDKAKAFNLFKQASEAGHLIAATQYSRRLVLGYDGLTKIPLGFLKFLACLGRACIAKSDDREDDRFAR